jgi:hypothetical protein
MSMKCVWAGLAVGAAGLTGAWAGGRPDLSIVLGERNAGAGLVVPSGGDGVNEPCVVEGRSARRMAGEASRYLYVRVDHASWTHGPVDAWAVLDVFDDRVARVGLHYDRASASGGARDPYAEAPRSCWLTGGRAWRRIVFPLPGLALGHGQNHGADFRLHARGLAVSRIELTDTKPPDADASAVPAGLAVRRPGGMELTFGNDASPEDAAVFRMLSVSSVESYVDWAGVEPERDRWDWSKWDAQVAVLESSGLKWVPFLIAGPAYATPLWFQDGPESRFYRCLEHGKESRVQSLFNPALRPQVERFIAAFAARYRDRGVIESLLLGVTGIYGESIYPAGPEGGWTARLTGAYHNHAGWWAADPLAAAAFRDAMRGRYPEVAVLNRAWATAHASFDTVAPFLPAQASNDRARADFVEWYQQAMTDWSVFWARTVRRHFPATPIYLCTGGDGDPVLGADFTAQAAAIAPFGAGIRITNEGSDYANNFTLTREVATATRAYGTFCGFEPASGVDATGNVARVYNASASGARQLHCYTSNVLGGDPESLDLFVKVAPLLSPRIPKPDLAIYLPRETWALEPAANGRLRAIARAVRDVADPDFVTRRTVVDGHLRGHAMLLLAEAPVLDPAAADAIEAWVRAGGALVVATQVDEHPVAGRLHDLSAWRERLLPALKATPSVIVDRLDGPAPARWVLRVGSDGDAPWLDGDWHGPERRGDDTCRWSGVRPRIRLPSTAGVAHELRLVANVPSAAMEASGIPVLVDGCEVGRITRHGAVDLVIEVPAPVAPGGISTLELQGRGWKPSELAMSTDPRVLGIEVRRIEWSRADAGEAAPGTARVMRAVDAAAVTAVTRPLGQGRVVFLPGLGARPDDLARVIAFLLPGAADGRLDGRFATRVAEGVLWLDPARAEIRLER